MNLTRAALALFVVSAILTPFRSYAEERPTKPTEFEKSGESKFDSGDYQGAVKDYTKAIEADSKNSFLFYYRGLAKMAAKDNAGAIKDASKAIELDPKNASAFYLRGSVKKEIDKNKEAVADFTEGLKLSPGVYVLQLNLYTGRASAKKGLKDYYGAVADYDEAIKLKPDKGLSYFLRGIVKLHLGEREAALKDLSKAGDLGVSDAYDWIEKIRENKL